MVLLAYLGDKLDDKRTWRVQDSANRFVVEHRPSGASVRCIGSDPRKAHGLQPRYIFGDEIASWDPTKLDPMLAALRTSLGKIPGSRLICIGTRAATPDHPFETMLGDPDTFSMVFSADASDPPFQKRTWLKANPSLRSGGMPDLESRIRREARLAKRDPNLLASFRALRLNMGVSDTVQNLLLDSDTWRKIEGDAERLGACYWGIDLGGSAASSAVTAWWPESGRLESIAAFPTVPGLLERGLRDGVGNLYALSAERGELLTLGGESVDWAELLREALHRFGRPAAIGADRWRISDLRDALKEAGVPRCPVEERGTGFKDNSEGRASFSTFRFRGSDHSR